MQMYLSLYIVRTPCLNREASIPRLERRTTSFREKGSDESISERQKNKIDNNNNNNNNNNSNSDINNFINIEIFVLLNSYKFYI